MHFSNLSALEIIMCNTKRILGSFKLQNWFLRTFLIYNVIPRYCIWVHLSG